MCAYPTTSNFCNAHEIFPLQVALARNDPIPRYISIYPPCIAKLYCFFREAKKKKKETRIKSPYQSTKRRVSSTMEGPKFYNRNVSQLVVIRGVDVTSGGNLSWRRALPAFGVSPGAVRSMRTGRYVFSPPLLFYAPSIKYPTRS